jgi:DNA-binding response OmpR family regulator
MCAAVDSQRDSRVFYTPCAARVCTRHAIVGQGGVTTTTDSQEVCALHLKNHYDLILLDLQMPGMDGFQIKERRALKAGARDFTRKPFELVEVTTHIHNMLEVRLLYRQLENCNEALDLAVQERTAELRESESHYRSLVELASDWH